LEMDAGLPGLYWWPLFHGLAPQVTPRPDENAAVCCI
jgi:hypothetical protein